MKYSCQLIKRNEHILDELLNISNPALYITNPSVRLVSDNYGIHEDFERQYQLSFSFDGDENNAKPLPGLYVAKSIGFEAVVRKLFELYLDYPEGLTIYSDDKDAIKDWQELAKVFGVVEVKNIEDNDHLFI